MELQDTRWVNNLLVAYWRIPQTDLQSFGPCLRRNFQTDLRIQPLALHAPWAALLPYLVSAPLGYTLDTLPLCLHISRVR